MVKTKFENQEYGKPEDFNDDMPRQLSALLDKEMFEKLLKAKNFKNMALLREETSEVFKPILHHWQGPVAENTHYLLETKIAIAASAGKDALMSWYLERVRPLLFEFARAEA